MKKIIILLCFIASMLPVFAQNPKADSIVNAIINSETNARLRLVGYLLYDINELTQQSRVDYAKKVLDFARKEKDRILESLITAELGYILAINGNSLQGAELAYTALEMAQKHKNKEVLGVIYQDLAICFRNDSAKHKEFLLKALPNLDAPTDYTSLTATLSTISRFYGSANKGDSALHYAQRSYELCLSKKIDADLPVSIIDLAYVHYYNLNNRAIAMQYIQQALRLNIDLLSPDKAVIVYKRAAKLFLDDGKADSALYYTNQASGHLAKARFTSTLDVYDLYKNIYSNTNKDSAVKYYKAYDVTKDSIDKMSNAQQQQILGIKKDLEIENAALQRKQNIQYALLAFGIITFVILFLAFSRRHITNTKVIQFLGVVALLVVFEFLNLLLHPFLERITHHNPIFMLLALVCIAALLVPLHHKLEKWATHKLVEKNKQIRLASAKKTIEELEKNKL
ncbi:MAG: hypothetical protein IPJ29_10845 [Chitinophagaceae bacterium]|nr:hypothetical protein [Chitinophagaceae bacterium]